MYSMDLTQSVFGSGGGVEDDSHDTSTVGSFSWTGDGTGRDCIPVHARVYVLRLPRSTGMGPEVTSTSHRRDRLTTTLTFTSQPTPSLVGPLFSDRPVSDRVLPSPSVLTRPRFRSSGDRVRANTVV